MKYSLRTLMIVVTLVCVALGVCLIWVRLERERTKRKGDAAKTLLARGALLAVPDNIAEADAELQTWRGDEHYFYINECLFCPKSEEIGKKRVAEKDLALLSSEFANLQEIQFVNCEIEAGGLRHLARLTKLKTIYFDNTNASDDEIQFLNDAFGNGEARGPRQFLISRRQ